MDDWTEKYRPQSLDDIVGNERAVSQLRRWADSWGSRSTKKAVILSGKPGIGKTSCALALASEYRWAVIELNASDARNATKIKKIATMGSINETFDEHGRFMSSQRGERKLIILDEADNLYEHVRQQETSTDNLGDKGGKKAIVDTIRITNQPIILIVNDYYSLIRGSGELLKGLCMLIKFYSPYPNLVVNLLKRIAAEEKILVDAKAFQVIADRCKGDIRSAINDLQSICLNRKQIDVHSLDVVGYRDREKIIFDALREIFKTTNIQGIRESMSRLDVDPQTVLLWVNENLPTEYKDARDLALGYQALSTADVFLGRTRKRQEYGLWSYACDIMNAGVATAKTRDYSNERYTFPRWLRGLKANRSFRDISDPVLIKLAELCHNSKQKGKDFLFNYFMPMFRNNTMFAVAMKRRLNFTENEIKFLLGKNYAHKVKDIIHLSGSTMGSLVNEQSAFDEEDKQQTLLDF